MDLPLISAFEIYLPVLPVTVMVICRSTLFVVERAVMVQVCDEREPREPPASRPVTTPVSGSTHAIFGSDDVHTISEMSPVVGEMFVGSS